MTISLGLTDIHQIVSDPVQAVSDAVDEVSSLLNKFHGAETYLQFHYWGLGTIVKTQHLSPSRVCTRLEWPHVCSHLRCRGSISSERRVCPLLLRWRRYRNPFSWQQWVRWNHILNVPLPGRHLGNFYLSYVDPVVIGRQAFHSVDDMVGGAVASVKDVLCAAVDETIDVISDLSKGLHLLNSEKNMNHFQLSKELIPQLA